MIAGEGNRLVYVARKRGGVNPRDPISQDEIE